MSLHPKRIIKKGRFENGKHLPGWIFFKRTECLKVPPWSLITITTGMLSVLLAHRSMGLRYRFGIKKERCLGIIRRVKFVFQDPIS